MKKIRKRIRADQLIKLWDLAHDKQWNQVLKNFDADVLLPWRQEINQMFNKTKQQGSFGKITSDNIAFWASTNTETPPVLERTSYFFKRLLAPPYSYDPEELLSGEQRFTYVKTGTLRDLMGQDSQYTSTIKSDGMSVSANIPEQKYVDMEEGIGSAPLPRSFLKAAFVLAWPKIIDNILKDLVDI